MAELTYQVYQNSGRLISQGITHKQNDASEEFGQDYETDTWTHISIEKYTGSDTSWKSENSSIDYDAWETLKSNEINVSYREKTITETQSISGDFGEASITLQLRHWKSGWWDRHWRASYRSSSVKFVAAGLYRVRCRLHGYYTHDNYGYIYVYFRVMAPVTGVYYEPAYEQRSDPYWYSGKPTPSTSRTHYEHIRFTLPSISTGSVTCYVDNEGHATVTDTSHLVTYTYNQTGWAINGTAYSSTYTPTANFSAIPIYTVSEAHEYSLQVRYYDGEVIYSDETVEQTQSTGGEFSVVLPDEADVWTNARAGYTLDGWVVDDTTYEPGDTISLQYGYYNAVAVWVPIEYPVTVDLNGGSYSTVPAGWTLSSGTISKNWDYGTNLSTILAELTGITRAGYISPQFSPAEGTVPVDGITITVSWTTVTYTITFHPNNGRSDYTQTYTIESSDVSLTNPGDKSYYTWGGWYDNSRLQGTAKTVVPTGSFGDKAYWGKWTPITYAITYVLNGGVNENNPPTQYDVETAVTLPSNPTKPYYNFEGWFDNSEFTGNRVQSIPTGSNGAKTYYAKWTPITYNINYILNGGTNSANNPSTYTVETEDITLEPATKTGYTFDGWYTE